MSIHEHTHHIYDNAGNATFSKTTQFSFTTGVSDRVTAVSMFYDALGRPTAIINHGTHGGGLSGQTDVARGNVNALRSDYDYSADGLLVTTTSPDGVVTEDLYTALGQLWRRREAVGETDLVLQVDAGASNSNQSVERSIEQKTVYEYDGLGRISQQEVTLGSDSPKTTEYWYDGQYLDKIMFPHEADDVAQSYFQYFDHNALGQQTKASLPTNGNKYNYFEYDVLGRLIQEDVSSVDLGGSQSVVSTDITQRLYQYDTLGNAIRIAAADDTGDEKNIVHRSFNAFGQITEERQDHDADGTTRDYHYLYANVNGGVRATGIAYVAANRTFTYAYDAGLDDAISRISAIQEGGSEVENYTYLGLGTVQGISTEPLGYDVVQTRAFDAFGRLAEQQWQQSTGASSAPFYSTPAHFVYNYSDAGTLQGIDDQSTLNHDLSFVYDELYRLTAQNGATAEDWDADIEGVHRSVEDTGQTLQKQTFVRPIFQGDWSASDFENDVLEPWVDQNSTTGSPDHVLTVQFDAWGRLTLRKDWSVEDYWLDDSDPTLESTRTYQYDALGRLIRRTFDDADSNANDTTRHFYHDPSGNILEERVWDGSSWTYHKTAVWSPVTGELVFEDHDTDNSNATSAAGLTLGNDARYLSLVDVRGDTVAVLDLFGSVVSRYAYTPSGKIERIFGTADPIRHLYQQGWRDAAGDYDGTILRGGLYHDALTNGVLTISVAQFWGDVTAIEVEPLSVYHQAVVGVASAWSTGVGYVTDGLNWLADGIDEAGGQLIHDLGWFGYVPTLSTAMTSGLVRVVSGLVGSLDFLSHAQAYYAYRDEGLSPGGSFFLAHPAGRGLAQSVGGAFTRRSYGPYDYGRRLTGLEHATAIAGTVSLASGAAAGAGTLGVAAMSTNTGRAIALSAALRTGRVPKVGPTSLTPKYGLHARKSAAAARPVSRSADGNVSLQLAPESNGVYKLTARFENIPSNMWSKFPNGVPRPSGPIKLVNGKAYDRARNAANNTNRRIQRYFGISKANFQIHEIIPIKFGGSPTSLTNKIGLLDTVHARTTTWFMRLQRLIEK